jgi:hypothetical protein
MNVRRVSSQFDQVAASKRAVPPLDPELGAVLDGLGTEPREPITPENLEARKNGMPRAGPGRRPRTFVTAVVSRWRSSVFRGRLVGRTSRS